MDTPVYLDHNATTPIDPLVLAAMEPYLREFYGNPSSIEHVHGHAAGIAVDRARAQVASAIGAQAKEIVFTGSCTEADNIAILGTARANPDKRHMITTPIEHPAVLEPMKALERQGWRVTQLPVDQYGLVTAEAVFAAITNETALVSVMGANNEVGALQPIRDIGAVCAARGVLFHADLAQTIAYHPVDVEKDNIHLASFSAHKAYGPKGIGALYVRSRKPRVKLEPLMFGGGQERSLRPGTLNPAAIAGMGEALCLCAKNATRDGERLRNLCEHFWNRISSQLPSAVLNGPRDQRLANNLSISIEGVEPLALMRNLRDKISFSASSACATDKMETSHVLLAMFGDTLRARQAFRIAPGRFTTENDMTMAAQAIIEEVRRLAVGTHAAA